MSDRHHKKEIPRPPGEYISPHRQSSGRVTAACDLYCCTDNQHATSIGSITSGNPCASGTAPGIVPLHGSDLSKSVRLAYQLRKCVFFWLSSNLSGHDNSHNAVSTATVTATPLHKLPQDLPLKALSGFSIYFAQTDSNIIFFHIEAQETHKLKKNSGAFRQTSVSWNF